MHELALFAGAGGGILGGRLFGWCTVCAVEIDPYCRRVLLARQRDGYLPRFPIWDDVRTFDGRPWRGSVDVVSGGFPCQDISSAGRGEGLAGKRSGLWFEMLRIIGEIRPHFVFAENSPNLRTRGLGTVVEGLASLGYDVRWCVLGACDVGSPHRRKRMWILAELPSERLEVGQVQGRGQEANASPGRTLLQRQTANTDGELIRKQHGRRIGSGGQGAPESRDADWWSVDRIPRVADGVADRVERVKATGNGQVPAVAALAWRVLRA